MVCESPADCQGKTYEALPPLEPGQMSVRSFAVTGAPQDPAAIVSGQQMPPERHVAHAEQHWEQQFEPEAEATTATPAASDSERDSLASLLGDDLFAAVSDLSAPFPSNFDINASLGGTPFGTVASHDTSSPVDHAVAQPKPLGITGDPTLDDFLNGRDAPELFRKNLRQSSQPPLVTLNQVPVHVRTANADGSMSYTQQVLPVLPSKTAAQR
jgi:hypothetical protein